MANYAPLQEKALWDVLVAMYEKVANLCFLSIFFFSPSFVLEKSNFLSPLLWTPVAQFIDVFYS
jgi:hypothetical protein